MLTEIIVSRDTRKRTKSPLSHDKPPCRCSYNRETKEQPYNGSYSPTGFHTALRCSVRLYIIRSTAGFVRGVLYGSFREEFCPGELYLEGIMSSRIAF